MGASALEALCICGSVLDSLTFVFSAVMLALHQQNLSSHELGSCL